MHGMCENVVKRRVVTGPPTKEKREIELFARVHLLKHSLCCLSELRNKLLNSGTKTVSRNLTS